MENENMALLFDKALKYNGLTKKEFAKESKIPYDTVAGWRKSGRVPDYAVALLKNIGARRKRGYAAPVTGGRKYAGLKTVDRKMAKRIQAAFWGKNYDYLQIIDAVEKGKPEFVKTFFENLFFKDVLLILGQKRIARLLPLLGDIFDEKTFAFWKQAAETEIVK